MQQMFNKAFTQAKFFFKNKYNTVRTFTNYNQKFKVTYYLIFILMLSIVFTLFVVISAYLQIQLAKNLAIWLGVGLSFYWIISAVWCLYDKDDYGRNVSASDDFYNTSFTALWLVEGFLLSLFLSYAKLFDFYDPFLESDEIESTFTNEDIDSGNQKQLLFGFFTALLISCVIDILVNFESINFFWLIIVIFVLFLWLFLSFVRISVRFLEEMDFEEDGEDLLDDNLNIFEHEDFPEEGFDGGDYAEGYEILQLFFGYWHYMLILFNLLYVIYAFFSSKGKQTHIYWMVLAICQNMVLIVILDFLDWGEVFLNYEVVSIDSIYFWFYNSEDYITCVTSLFNDILQIINPFLIYNEVHSVLIDMLFNQNRIPSNERFIMQTVSDIVKQ